MKKNTVQIGPVSKDLLYIKVADAIFDYAKANQLQAGDKLPSERELAKMFQTGRNSVREAMRVLENRGMIEVKTGLGTFLKEPPEEISSVQLKLMKENLYEFQELKVTLEHMAVRKAIQSANLEGKQELLKLAEEMMELYDQDRYDDDLDHEFHMKLMELAENQTIAQIVNSLRIGIFQDYWNELEYDPYHWVKTVPDHLVLANAIIDKDEERAITAIDAIDGASTAVMKQAGMRRRSETEEQ
ncbi:GntR family transcriptional regulator [Ruminococcus sp. OA3]|uniref:FadR/GntR family transcriptional regulator n=1 Tax=Ruminococcus sp. OA3 TaxID=2914164 RepID=UPI001F0652B1|nr:FCD domain-containing protein [Ruminococcus sp. OA3]MCH1984034.1 GntR family transcriptional regulator [Ruminococcus sp. OA3]